MSVENPLEIPSSVQSSDIPQLPTPGRISHGGFFALLSKASEDEQAINKDAIKNLKPQGFFTPEEARDALAKLLSPEETAPLSQDGLVPSSVEETPLDTTPSRIDGGLRKTLREGPSSLIDGQIQERLGVVTAGRVSVGGIPKIAWMLNPKAWIEALRAMANDASTQAGVQREISETAESMAKVAGDDAKRNALLDYNESLEAALSQYVKPFCEERGLVVPGENTLGRMALLLRMNAEMRALNERGREIARAGEILVRKHVRIQAETAKNTMLDQELPQALEVAREANVAKEAFLAERARNALASIAAAFSGGLSGTFGGLISGIENTISTLVKEHPKVAIPLGAGLGIVTLQLVSYNGLLTWNVLGSFALKGLLVSGITAVTTGVGAGLVARWTDRSSNLPPVPPLVEENVISGEKTS